MPHSLWSLIPFGIAAVLLQPSQAPARAVVDELDEAQTLRDRGPAALAVLLARFDKMPAGAERDALGLLIDRVAGQRYATVSRMYWHTDLSEAKAAAKQTKKPILALRMLGRLDEDLSCANSRLFRTTLYANAETSKFLRDNFILYWSSERAVPKVTIDFGDGRKLESTTTGNSAHYILDADGHVLDVLPGLYAPIAFRKELTKSLALAKQVAGKSDDARHIAIAAHQKLIFDQSIDNFTNTPYIGGMRRLIKQGDVTSALARAQRATMAKAYIEVPALRWTGHDAGELPDVARFASIGQVLYGIGDLKAGRVEPPTRAQVADRAEQAQAKATPAPRILDDQSRALVMKLHTAAFPATADELVRVIERLEQHLVADSALNQLDLRRVIARRMIDQGKNVTLDDLNAWIYEHVFHTPRSDAWLGLLPRTDFTGVPGDGVVR